jgi:hypothetical protein
MNPPSHTHKRKGMSFAGCVVRSIDHKTKCFEVQIFAATKERGVVCLELEATDNTRDVSGGDASPRVLTGRGPRTLWKRFSWPYLP